MTEKPEAVHTGHRCGFCNEPLWSTDVSDYFCRPSHQQLYYEARSMPLTPEPPDDYDIRYPVWQPY